MASTAGLFVEHQEITPPSNFHHPSDATSLCMIATMALAFILVDAPPLAAQGVPFPEAGMARDVPGAKEMPDPNIIYKIAFDQINGPDESGDVSAGLMTVANRYNTLISRGVPADHIQFVVLIHREATDTILNNDAYRKRHGNKDNPDIAMIKKMSQVGIDFRVCGQAVLGREIEPEGIMPEVELDLWAWTTFTNLQLRGFIRQGV